MNIPHTSCAEQASLPKTHRAVVKNQAWTRRHLLWHCYQMPSFFTQICNSHYFILCVEILVCMQHLKAGTGGPTDALVLPHLQLPWLLVALATARQIIPLLWKADKMPSVSAWLSKLILQCEKKPKKPKNYPALIWNCTWQLHGEVECPVGFLTHKFLSVDTHLCHRNSQALTFPAWSCSSCHWHWLTLIMAQNAKWGSSSPTEAPRSLWLEHGQLLVFSV